MIHADGECTSLKEVVQEQESPYNCEELALG